MVNKMSKKNIIICIRAKDSFYEEVVNFAKLYYDDNISMAIRVLVKEGLKNIKVVKYE
jgi:hypothetical protein